MNGGMMRKGTGCEFDVPVDNHGFVVIYPDGAIGTIADELLPIRRNASTSTI
jgi:hypothetical protein